MKKSYTLTLSKGVPDENGRRYHVEFSGGGWYEMRTEFWDWCKEQFGDTNDNYNNPRWAVKYGQYWDYGNIIRFKFERDATWFMMRWA